MKTQNKPELWKTLAEGLPSKELPYDFDSLNNEKLPHLLVCDEAQQAEPVLIYRSEIDAIYRLTVEWGAKETGGHLYGAYTGSGTPVVMLATPPGPKATHSSATFTQDIDYFQRCSEMIYKRFGLCFIGRWHSHHFLGLHRPSMGDIASANSLIAKNPIPTFVELITTMSPSESGVTVNAYIYR